MPDTYTLHLKNFRSIRDAKIDIAPLTVIYGPNGTGKSSLIYGLLTLKNFLTNPAQNIPSLFSYPTMSLGGFDEVVSNHVSDSQISLSLDISTPAGSSEFTLGIGRSGGQSTIHADLNPKVLDQFRLTLDIPFPYRANQAVPHRIKNSPEESTDTGDFALLWNGISLIDARADPTVHQQILSWLTTANLPMELARRTGFVPLRRGFTSPTYSEVSVTPSLSTEDEVASLLAKEESLQYEVSGFMEDIANRRVNPRLQFGTTIFSIDSIPTNGGVHMPIVNDGFGINQLAYMLTVSLSDQARIVAVEEPETHLHPSMVRNLVRVMAEIAKTHDRRFIVSTHSETFVVSLLAQIAAGKVSVDDVSFILAEKEDGESRFTKQEAKSNGQIQGGLHSFMASELEDIAVFLGLND